MLRRLATAVLCVSSLVSAADKAVASKHLMASSQNYAVTHDGSGFKVNGQRVHDYDLDASLRKPGSLKNLFKSDRSKLEVTRVGSDYAIKRHEQLKGGGIVAGSIAYWVTKAVCYGVAGGAVAGVGTAAVALAPVGGPIAAAIGGVALPGAGLAGTAASGIAAGIAGTASAAAASNAAAMAVASTAASAGGVAGVVTTIESASTTMGYIFTMIPWLP